MHIKIKINLLVHNITVFAMIHKNTAELIFNQTTLIGYQMT